jgi:hypothetical protein
MRLNPKSTSFFKHWNQGTVKMKTHDLISSTNKLTTNENSWNRWRTTKSWNKCLFKPKSQNSVFIVWLMQHELLLNITTGLSETIFVTLSIVMANVKNVDVCEECGLVIIEVLVCCWVKPNVACLYRGLKGRN